jgi:HD-GYP domain-containing protein (c-di-GMP phosphodiesterase class II)
METAVHYVGMVAIHLSSSPEAFASIVEMMDLGPDLYAHAVNTCTYAVALGAAIGLMRSVLITIGASALVHDVGLTQVPARILNKADDLAPEEVALVRQHPDLGAEMVGPLAGGQELMVTVVRNHHEQPDGQGYPRGLRGDQIDSLTRIVSLADTYSTLTSGCPSGAPSTPFEALDAMRRMPGAIDPGLFAEFVRLLGRDASSR